MHRVWTYPPILFWFVANGTSNMVRVHCERNLKNYHFCHLMSELPSGGRVKYRRDCAACIYSWQVLFSRSIENYEYLGRRSTAGRSGSQGRLRTMSIYSMSIYDCAALRWQVRFSRSVENYENVLFHSVGWERWLYESCSTVSAGEWPRWLGVSWCLTRSWVRFPHIPPRLS